MKTDPVHISQEADGCYQSRWGYHAVDFATFKKIKALRRCYELTLRQLAARGRWARKLPENRVIRTYARNAAGQRVGVESVKPMPQPEICPVMLLPGMRMHVLAMWKQCRRPSATPVPKLSQADVAAVDLLATQFAGYEASRKKK